MIRDDLFQTAMSVLASVVTCSVLSACGGGAPASADTAVSAVLANTSNTTVAINTTATATATATAAITASTNIVLTPTSTDTAAIGTTASTADTEAPVPVVSTSDLAVDDATAMALGVRTVRAATAGNAVAAPTVVANVAAATTLADLQASNAAAWPFVQPPLATLRASGKKVFAHYFTPFPISLDNLIAPGDYYGANYLLPQGEGGRFAASGGYIKQRPLPRPPVIGAWDQSDALQEVRRAVALGIDGFAVDLLATSGVHWDRARRMLDSANAVDTGFKILLMPDMEAEFKAQPQNVIVAVRALASHPAAYRLADGRVVLAPYNAQNQSVEWWTALISALKAEGINVAFFPVFQAWYQYAASYAPISVGMSDWGVRSPAASKAVVKADKLLRTTYKTLWMGTVSPQDNRPKDFMYWEARNSENYRVMWEGAISSGSDWVHVVSWNDYSEGTEIAPSSGTQWSFYDLTAYYTAWFKTGTKPVVTRDVLYYFHRKQAATAVPSTLQKQPYTLDSGSDVVSNDIELLAFATAPCTLRITIAGKVTEQSVAAGMFSMRVPLAEGTPVFELLRNGSTVASATSAFPISNSITYQDLLYRSGASTRSLIAPQ